MALLLFAVLTIPVFPFNAYAQGPPPGAQTSQLGSLADRWTKWIVSLDTNTEPNPFETVYQGDCSQLIQGRTMFLVGQRGGTTDLEDHGNCSISSGTTIFFPLVNYIVADCTSKQQQSPQLPSGLCASDIRIPAEGQPFADLRELANSNIDRVDNLEATLDDEPLEFARVQSPPGGFVVRVSPNNALFGDLTFLFQRPISLHAVVDGHWGLVTSLSPGEHTLTFGGCFDTSDCQTNTYELVVRR
jgi:hypothetical protein